MRYEGLLASRYIKAQKRQSVFTVISIAAAAAIMTIIFLLYSLFMSCSRNAVFSTTPYHLIIHELTEEQGGRLQSIEPVSSVKLEAGEDSTVTAYVLFDRDFGDELQWIQNALEKIGAKELYFRQYPVYQWNSKLMKYDGIGNGAQLAKLRIFCIFFIFAVLAAFALRLVIDTAFEVSSKERERHYGVLQSIGATPEQIVRIITSEGLRLCLIAVPLGIAAGTALAYAMYQAILSAGLAELFQSMTNKKLSLPFTVDWRMLLVAAVVSVVWVFLSAYGVGMRIIKKTPMEAITARADEVTKIRRRTLSGLLFGISGSIASRNARRQKKRFVITVLTLTVSITMFAIFSSLTETVENSISAFLAPAFTGNDADFLIALEPDCWETYPELAQQIADSGLFKDVGLNILKQVGLVKNDSVTDFCYIYYVNREYYRQLSGENPKFSYDELVRTGGYLCSASAASRVENGRLKLRLSRRPDAAEAQTENAAADSENTREVQVLGTAETLPMPYSWGETMLLYAAAETYSAICTDWFLSDSRGLYAECSCAFAGSGNYNAADYTTATGWFSAHSDTMVLEDDFYGDKLKLHNIMSAIRAGVLMMNVLIALTALINLLNIISTGIANRRSELASLQCIGMTEGQLRGMAVIECLQFTAAAAVISALICLAVILSVEKGLVPWMQSTFEDAADTYYRKLISDIVRLDHVTPFVRTAAAALTAFAAGSITSVIMLRTQNTESLSDQIRGSVMQLDLKKTHLLRRGLIGTGQKK